MGARLTEPNRAGRRSRACAQFEAKRTAAVHAAKVAVAYAAEMRQVLEQRVAELQERLRAASSPPAKD